MNVRLLILLAGLVATSAQAEIYKHVDENGRVTYSNMPIKGAKKLILDPLPTVSAVKPKAAASPTDFPKVDAKTQKERDNLRHKILSDELAAEEKLLVEAKRTLAEAEAIRTGDERNYQRVLDRLQPLKDNVALHEKNIEALRKEIANLK